jgi:reactive intermediate/imine deaminase
MKKIDPLFKGINKGHYSHGIASGGMLYISGQLSIDPDTREIPAGGVSDHARQALDNFDRVLRAAGLGRASVVQCRIYVTDISGWDEVNSVYAEFFGDHKPARAIVPVPSLHFGCKVEIEGIAELSPKGELP